jgi:hypothetical protein
MGQYLPDEICFESAEEPHKIAMGMPATSYTVLRRDIAVERRYSAFRKDKANPRKHTVSRSSSAQAFTDRDALR